jgi:ankyrin repeat protein
MNNKNLEEPLLPPAKGLTLRNTMPSPSTVVSPSENEERLIPSPSKTIKPATAWNRIYFGGRKKKLIYAAGKGDLSLVKELIEDYGIDINSATSDYDGMTALISASKWGNLEIVHYLVEHGANVNAAMTTDGMTALMWACEKGHLEIVRYLVGHGANVNAARTDGGHTSLMWACFKGHLEIVRCLVEHGANVNAARTNDGITALMWACAKGHLEIVRCLVENGANVNAAYTDNGMTALMSASSSGRLEIVRYLCQNGADATITDKDGKKAIDFNYTKDPNIQNILLEGCSSQAKGGYYRRIRCTRRHKKHSKHATRLRKRK